MSGFAKAYRHHLIVILYATFTLAVSAGIDQAVLAPRLLIPFAIPILITAVTAPPHIYRLLSLILLAATFAALLINSPHSARNWQLFLLMWGVLILAAEILRWLSERQRRTEEALRQSQQQLNELLSRSLNDLSITTAQEPMGWDEMVEQLTLFHTVVESSGEAIAISVPGGRLAYVNPAHERLFGYPAMEATKKHYRAFFPPDTLAFIEQEVEPALQRGKQWKGDLVAKRADGSHFILRSSMGTLLDDQGDLLYGFSFMQDVTARREAEAAAHRQRVMAELLEETAVLLTSSLRFEDVIEAILKNVGRVIPHRSTALFLLNEAEQLFHLYTIEEQEERIVRSRPLTFTLSQLPILQQMAQSGEPRLIDDIRHHPEWIDHPETPWIRSFVGAPLQAEDETLGFLVLLSDESEHFHSSHLDLLAIFGTQATIAIQNANRHAGEIERREALEALQYSGLYLTSSLELPQVLDQILQTIFDLVEARNAYIFLLENGRLVFEAGRAESGPVSQPFAPPRPEGITYTALQRQEPVIVQDSQTAPVFADAPPDWDRFSIISLPIQFKEETLGVLNVASSTRRPLTPLKCRTLQTLTAYAAVAIQNAHLHAQVRQHATELEQRVRDRTVELKRERNRLQAILDNVGDGIFFTDEKGRIRFTNPALEEITGYPAKVLIGRTPRIWRGTTPPGLVAEMEEALRTGSPWSGELINRRRNGTLYDAYVTITPLLDKKGVFQGYVGSQRDITHLKELNRLKDQFVSRIGHELITPVTTLLLYLDLIKYDPEEDVSPYLETLQRETERLRKLVLGFLRLADLNTDKSQVRLISSNVKRQLKKALPRWQAEAKQHALILTCDFAEGSLSALVDQDLLIEAIEILLDNSFNYTPPHETIFLTVSRRRGERSWITITVSDTGPGIVPDEIPHIFDRFYRGEITQQYKIPGAGLGLAICREIINQLEGRITVESEPGQGATFTLWLNPAPASEA